MKIIIAFIIAALIYLVLKVIKLVLKKLINQNSALYFMNNIMLAVVSILWLGYAFWTLSFLFQEKIYYQYLVFTLILIIVALLTWYLIRDIVAGIIFRVKHNLRTGSYFRIGEFSGQIKNQHLTHLIILMEDGQPIRIPYSKIIDKSINELINSGVPEEQILHLQADSSLGRTNAESLIRSVVLNTAWSNPKDEPVIRFLKETEKGLYFEITHLSRNLKQMKFIEMGLDETPKLHIIHEDSSKEI